MRLKSTVFKTNQEKEKRFWVSVPSAKQKKLKRSRTSAEHLQSVIFDWALINVFQHKRRSIARCKCTSVIKTQQPVHQSEQTKEVRHWSFAMATAAQPFIPVLSGGKSSVMFNLDIPPKLMCWRHLYPSNISLEGKLLLVWEGLWKCYWFFDMTCKQVFLSVCLFYIFCFLTLTLGYGQSNVN